MAMESVFFLRKVHNGLLHFAAVKLLFEENNSGHLEVITQYGKNPSCGVISENLPEKRI